MHILYVGGRDGEHRLRSLVEFGHVIERSADPRDAALRAAAGDYDAILSDLTVPQASWVQALAKANGRGVLVLLTEDLGPEQRAELLRAGADACLDRSIAFVELSERLLALSRPSNPRAALFLDSGHRAARFRERSVALSTQEYSLLALFARHEGEVLSTTRIHESLWGEAKDPRPDRVRLAVLRLRRRLRSAFGVDFIAGRRGYGYRLLPMKGPENGDEDLFI